MSGNRKYHKVRDYFHNTGKQREAAHNIFNLRYKTLKEFPILIHNGYTYNYLFIIKKLAKELEKTQKNI